MRSNLAIAMLTMTAVISGCACATSVNTPTTPSDAAGAASSYYPPPWPPPSSGCVAGQAQWVVGQPATDDLLEKARVAAQANVARFVRHDEQITMEHLPGRLTLFLDSRREVRSVVCG